LRGGRGWCGLAALTREWRGEVFAGACGVDEYNAGVRLTWGVAVALLPSVSQGGTSVLLPFTRKDNSMEDRQRFKAEMIMRVVELGAAESDIFKANTLGGKLFADLNGIVTELNAHAAGQSSGRTAAAQGTTTKAGGREAVREDLEAISRTARAMAEEIPGLEDKFRLPRGNANDQTLIAAARAFAKDALSLKAKFIEYGLAEDFIEDLNEDVADFEVAVNAQAAGLRQQVTATAAIDEVIERGMKIIRRLDAIVPNTFRDNPAKLAAWQSARHVERAPRHKSKITSPPQK
jgi:hypothetical protein